MRLNILFILLFYSLSAPVLAARLELRQAGTGGTDISVLVGEEIEVELWVDSEGEALSGTVVFLSFDETAFELVDQNHTTATSGFQPFTQGDFLGNGEIYRNDLLPPDDPAAASPGTQLDYSVVRASDQGTGTVASFRLRARAPEESRAHRHNETHACPFRRAHLHGLHPFISVGLMIVHKNTSCFPKRPLFFADSRRWGVTWLAAPARACGSRCDTRSPR